jgi:uncharacterized protein (DUF608 family)
MQSIFPKNLPEREWVEFKAEGFSKPVTGVIHKGNNPPTCGMPLGAIDTGCIDLEADGTFGFSTIFNSHVPRRGPLNTPFVGLSVNSETWVLSTRELKGCRFGAIRQMQLRKAAPVKEIHYWGHYPVADMEFEMDCPVSVSMRSWAPFIPGDVKISNTPGTVFELHLRNTSDSTVKGSAVFSFPGPSPQEASGNYNIEPVEGKFSGAFVTNDSGVNYALGVIDGGRIYQGREAEYNYGGGGSRPLEPKDGENIRIGGDLGIDGFNWSRFEQQLPVWSKQPGASVVADFELEAHQEKVIRYVMAWYAPDWNGTGSPTASGKTNTFTHMYASQYKNALEVANTLAEQHESLLRRILAWQEVVYSEESLPAWLKESLINSLHLITEDGLWAQAKSPIGEWCKPEDGLFGLNESPRSCPQMECIPCSFIGNLPLSYFFPQLALSTLRGYKAYMYDDGAAPWTFGGCTAKEGMGNDYLPGDPHLHPSEMSLPCRGYQTTTNGLCFVGMVSRYLLCNDDDEVLKEFYPFVKKNTNFTMNLRPEYNLGDRVISMPAGNTGSEWYEACEWAGMVTHVGGLHLAQIRMAQRMAERVGDTEFAKQCEQYFKEGSNSLESKMWNGNNYLHFNEPETKKKSELILAYQLDGQWMAYSHDLGFVFNEDRVKITLDTIKKTCIGDNKYGAVNFADPSGKAAATEKSALSFGYKPAEFFPGNFLSLAMTYMYAGQQEYGLEIARKSTEHIVLKQGLSWDAPNVIRTDTGEVTFGNDYYQMMIIWGLPAALAGQDEAGPCQSGGLVDRMIRAGK